MQWGSDQLGANMTTGRPTAWTGSNVDAQINDPNSLLRFYIRAINLKNRYPQIHWGTPTLIPIPGNAVSAYRVNSRGEMRDVAVVHNHGSSSQTVQIPGALFLGDFILAQGTTQPTLNGNSLTIPGFSLAIIEF
jgi:alpha-glucosidase